MRLVVVFRFSFLYSYFSVMEQYMLLNTFFSNTLVLNLFVIIFLFFVSSLFFASSFYWLLVSNFFKIFRSFVPMYIFNSEAGSHTLFIFKLFWLFISFIFIANLIGLLPFVFTLTAQASLVFLISFFFFFYLFLSLFYYRRSSFILLFVPVAYGRLISFFLFPLEALSVFSRLVSLPLRLFANIMAGHALLKIMIQFLYIIFNVSGLFLLLAVFPFILISLIIILEMFVGFLQGLVFFNLILIYISEI